MKRWIAALLTVAMLMGCFPLNVLAESGGPQAAVVAAAAEGPQAQEAAPGMDVQTDGMTVEATNSFGKLLLDSMDEVNGTENATAGTYNEGNKITSVEVEDMGATVHFSAVEDADLVVALYTEDELEMLASGYAEITAGQTAVWMSLMGEEADYFVVKAYLLAKEDHAPISPAFSTLQYTKEIIDLSEATIDDFEEDRVINLDDDRTTNFAVVKEEVELVSYNDSAAGNNQIAQEDNENLVYTIENATEEFTALQPGEILVYEYEKGCLLIVQVESIDVTGDIITIYGDDTLEITDVFDALKIETDAEAGEFTYDGSTADEGVTYLGTEDVEDDLEATNAFEGEVGDKKSHKYKFFKEGTDEDGGNDEILSGSWKLEGTVKLEFSTKFAYYISKSKQSFSYTVGSKISGDIELSAKAELSISLGSLGFSPIAGVYIGFEPAFQIKAEAKVKGTISVEETINFGYDSIDGGFNNLSAPPSIEAKISAEGEIFVGIDMRPHIAVLGSVAKIKAKTEIGFKAKTEIDLANIDDLKWEESKHSCTICFPFDISFNAKIGVSVEVLKKNEEGVEITKSIALGKAYYSLTHNEFGWGECPHAEWLVSASVDAENSIGTTLYVVSEDSDALQSAGEVDENGCLKFYLSPGVYYLTAKIGGIEYKSDEFTISDSSVDVVLHTDYVEAGEIVTSGYCGAEGNGTNLTWKLYDTGTLIISGKGAMKDFYDNESMAPWYSERERITHVIVKNGATNIGINAFFECSNLLGIIIPDSVTSIGSGAFECCSSLTEITIPASVTSIEPGAFYKCSSLTEVEIPAGVTSIENLLFYECSSLIKVGIPASVTSIGIHAFRGCSSLTEVTIPEGVTNIELYTFFGCSSLTEVTIPEGVTSIGERAFEGCSGLTEITIPASVISIGNRAFGGCSGLTEVNILEGTTSIGAEAFGGCGNIAKITIPKSITSAGSFVLYPVDNLTDIYYGGTQQEWIEFSLEAGIVVNATTTNVHYNYNYNTTASSTTENTAVLSVADVDSVEIVNDTTNSIFPSEAQPEATGWQASFEGLIPNTEYAVIVSNSSRIPLMSGLLVYITQITADENGELTVYYRQSDPEAASYVVACGSGKAAEPSEPSNPSKPGNNPGNGSGGAGSSGGDGGGAALLLAAGAGAVAAVVVATAILPVEVSGTVTDETGAVLPGVTVTLRQNGEAVKEVVTNENGWYSVKVKKGHYELTACYTDAATGKAFQQTVSLTAPDKSRSVTLDLSALKAPAARA